MSNEAKPNSGSNVGGGFRSRMEHYLYSGDKKHVAVGIAIVGVVFSIPWYFMTKGSILSSPTAVIPLLYFAFLIFISKRRLRDVFIGGVFTFPSNLRDVFIGSVFTFPSI